MLPIIDQILLVTDKNWLRWTIRVAEIFYTNGTDAKKRPVLILWVDGQDAVVAVVTSAAPRTVTDIFLTHWAESGLRVPSTVRLSRLDCLELSLFSEKSRSVV
jgi:mRNA interferase MazF